MAKSYELITEEMITRNLDIVKAFQLQLKIKTLEIWKKDSTKDIFTTSILKEIKENKIIKEFDINTGDLTIDDSQILNYEDFKILKENNNKKIKSLETTILHLKSEVNIWILNFILNWTLEMKTTKYQEMFATDIHNLEEILEIKDWNEQIKTNDDFNAITLKMAPKIKSTLEYILETIKNDKHNNNTIKLEFWKEKIQQFTVIKKIETTILWNFMAKGYDNVSFLRIDTDKLEIEKLLDSTTFHKKKIVENLPNEKELQTMIKAKFNYFTEKKFDFMNFDIIFNFHIVNKQIEEWKLTAIKESNKKSKNKQKHIKIFLYNLNLLKDSIFKFTNEQFINRFTNKIEEINSKEKRFNENKLFSTTLDSFIKETEKTYSFVDISPIEDLILQTSTIPELIPNVSHQGIEIQQSIVLNQISQKQQKEDIKQFMIDKGLEEESTATDKKQIKKKKKRQSSKNTTQFKQENLETSVSFTNKDKQNLTNVKSENKAELITKPNPISQENNIAIPSTSKESKTHNASQKLDEPQEIITKETEQFKKLKNENKNLTNEVTTLTTLIKETTENLQNTLHINTQQCERNKLLKNEKDNLVKVNKELTNQIQNSNAQKEKRKLQEKLKKNETLVKEVTSKLTQLEIENQQLTIQNQQRLSTEIELQNKIETLNQELQNLQPAVDLSSSYDLCPATCVTKHIQNVTSTYTQYLYESSNNNTIVTPVEVTTDIPVVVAVNIESGVYLKPKIFPQFQWTNETLNLSNISFSDEIPNSNLSSNSVYPLV